MSTTMFTGCGGHKTGEIDASAEELKSFQEQQKLDYERDLKAYQEQQKQPSSNGGTP